jgi:hypothetical protein
MFRNYDDVSVINQGIVGLTNPHLLHINGVTHRFTVGGLSEDSDLLRIGQAIQAVRHGDGLHQGGLPLQGEYPRILDPPLDRDLLALVLFDEDRYPIRGIEMCPRVFTLEV